MLFWPVSSDDGAPMAATPSMSIVYLLRLEDPTRSGVRYRSEITDCTYRLLYSSVELIQVLLI